MSDFELLDESGQFQDLSDDFEFVDWFATQCRLLGIREIPVCMLKQAMESKGLEIPKRTGVLLGNCGYKSRMYKGQRWYDITKKVMPWDL